MLFSDIVTLVTAKVGKTDDYAKALALDFVQTRHRQIYQSYDWTAALDTQTITIPDTISVGESVQVTDAEKIISARFGGESLDPVSPSFIFETHPELISAEGTPLYYWSHYDIDNATCTLRLYPTPTAGGDLELLIKNKFDDASTSSAIPDLDDCLTTFALADMWEFLRQIGKYQAKLAEANDMLAKVQARDTPSAPKPRTSKRMSANGSTLMELTDSVCDIIGRWEPDIRLSVQERIRRNYQTLWDMNLLPESLIIANVDLDANQRQVILPVIFDKIIAVRTNQGGELTRVTPLKNAQLSYYFNVSYNIFEQSGEPVSYASLATVATTVLPAAPEPLQFHSNAGDTGGGLHRFPQPSDATDEGVKVYVKGEYLGVENEEIVELLAPVVPGPGPTPDDAGWASSVNYYETPITISKPPNTAGSLFVRGAISKTSFLELQPQETEHKNLRIALYPNLGSADGAVDVPGSVLVCGKRRAAQLLDDGDSPQIRNCQNILINAAAADMMQRLGNAELSAALAQKAGELTKILVKGETEQATQSYKVTPFAENYSRRGRFVTSTFP